MTEPIKNVKCESCETEFELKDAIRCECCNLYEDDTESVDYDDDVSVDSWDGKKKHLYCIKCTEKCDACKERGCKNALHLRAVIVITICVKNVEIMNLIVVVMVNAIDVILI